MSIHSWGIGREGVQRALYSPRETEAILGISHATLYRLINAGRLEARKIDNKTVITDKSIRRFIEALPKACEAALDGAPRYREARDGIPPREQPMVQPRLGVAASAERKSPNAPTPGQIFTSTINNIKDTAPLTKAQAHALADRLFSLRGGGMRAADIAAALGG